jgi:hypothetical protein
MTYKLLRNFTVFVNFVLKHFTRSDEINQSCSNKYWKLWAHVCIFVLVILHVIAFLYTVLYRHLWPVWLHHIFPHYLINGTIFGKSYEYEISVLISSTNFVRNTSHSKKKSARYTALPVKIGRICCPETSVRNYQTTLRKVARSARIPSQKNISQKFVLVQCSDPPNYLLSRSFRSKISCVLF